MILETIIGILKANNYELYSRPYELNIVGLRSDSTVPNRFDDEIHVFYKNDSGRWNYHVFEATTDPGTFWLRNPIQPQGTSILSQGQYVGAYQIGLHKGQYKALVQAKDVKVIKDYDRDAVLDFNNGTVQQGIFGINIHRAFRSGDTLYVDKYSAGCQVFKNAEAFEQFLKLCEIHRERYGNSFTYTLVDFRAVNRANNRRWLSSLTGFAGLVGLGIYLWNEYEKSNARKKEKEKNLLGIELEKAELAKALKKEKKKRKREKRKRKINQL